MDSVEQIRENPGAVSTTEYCPATAVLYISGFSQDSIYLEYLFFYID